MGQVTAVPIVTRPVRWPMAASLIQACPACPWLSCQGWKWSLAQTASKPAASAATAYSISSPGANCSCESTYPTPRPLETAISLRMLQQRVRRCPGLMEHDRCSPYDVRMAAKVRVGVIGAGVMGRYHCETLALRLTGAELAAVADIDGVAAGPAASPSPGALATTAHRAP